MKERSTPEKYFTPPGTSRQNLVNWVILTLLLIILILPSTQGIAIDSAPPSQSSDKKKTALVPKKKTRKTLWNHWYTVTVDKENRYAYYNEKFTTIGKRVYCQSKNWRRTGEDQKSMDSILGVAQYDTQLTPLAFKYKESESGLKVTGKMARIKLKDKNLRMTVKSKRNGAPLPSQNRTLTRGTLFSCFFPLWLAQKLPGMRVGQTFRFHYVLEDNFAEEFRPQRGTIQKVQPDRFAKLTKTHRLLVKYKDFRATWWVQSDGKPYRIHIPKEKIVIKLVKKKKALSFLN